MSVIKLILREREKTFSNNETIGSMKVEGIKSINNSKYGFFPICFLTFQKYFKFAYETHVFKFQFQNLHISNKTFQKKKKLHNNHPHNNYCVQKLELGP